MKKYKLGDIVKQIKISEYFNQPENEVFVTVSGHGKGVSQRNITEGKTPVPFSGYRVKSGQLIYSRIGAADGAFGIIPDELNNAVVSKDFPIFEVNESIVRLKYLLYFLCSDFFYNKIGRQSSGATLKRLKEDTLINAEVSVPSLGKQEYILDVLSIIKEVIAQKQQQLQYLDILIKARFVEMFGGRKDKRALQELSIGKSGYGAASASIPYDPIRPRYVRITDINDDGTLNDDLVCSINKQDDVDYKLEKGDFLFARMGATVGKTYYYRNGNQIYAGYLIRFKLDPEKMLPEYLHACTRTEEYFDWVRLNQSGAAQPGINAQKYGALQIPVASIEEQKEFVKFVHQVDKSKFASMPTRGSPGCSLDIKYIICYTYMGVI